MESIMQLEVGSLTNKGPFLAALLSRYQSISVLINNVSLPSKPKKKKNCNAPETKT